ncbi:hypothetical protein FKG94_12235 [Exilibacterium tricleocarpae]|uniref:U32 family peptidase n=1 Tax=Exilibacterium tricleocarpae TaxID=2591008 RepID=A0A545TNI2_9GAMM|nr:U32 family peptidase [Exilibacterium tricleocarpae]TQV78783.1 hypothetical protein FKG94_12235 [Exilibacterium tricleocarpae]
MELVCPAGSLPALKVAVDNGADAVYIGFNDATNARHFSGLNFTDRKATKALDYTRRHHTKVFVAINTYPQPAGWPRWQRAVDIAADLDVSALIPTLAEIGIKAIKLEGRQRSPAYVEQVVRVWRQAPRCA